MGDIINFQTQGDRLPPQNIDAEESILGGILLDPEAIGRVIDRLDQDAFSLDAHKIIYRSTVTLHTQGKPTDLMTVTTWLSDQNLLTKIGGQSKLAQLVDRTVSAVNIDQYADLVMDKYIRRQLIHAGHEISELGYETTKDLVIVLDESEQKIFGLTQERTQKGLVPIAETLISTFNELELRNQDLVLPGLSCDFYDLDAMTGGFQRSDLVIVAGRPSMGKCLTSNSEIVLSDGSISTIEEIYHRRQAELLTLGKDWKFHFTQPIAFVDDGIKPVFRVTTRLGRSVDTTITHPYLTIHGWKPLQDIKLGDKIAVPRHLNIFGKEVISESEINLLSNLVGKDNFNINQAIPFIIFTLRRSQIALFLNRLFTKNGTTIIISSDQSYFYSTFSEKLAKQLQHLLLRFGIISALEKQDIKYNNTLKTAWELHINDSYSIQVFNSEIAFLNKENLDYKNNQINYSLLPLEIWHQITKIQRNESEAVLAQRAGIKKYSNIYFNKTDLSPEKSFNSEYLPLHKLVTGDIYWDEIVSIQAMGAQQVYDLTIPETHNFIANDICVHNTSFALNIAQNIATAHKLPVAVFSLEMSKEQLVQRMLASEAGIESNRLRSGRISQNEWDSLSKAISDLTELPIYIDDTPNMTVMQMRSQARRLQAENRGEIGLILLDYLQLMEGGSDNRVQEISKITRSLKSLARELNVPVIALSQLSRGVEARTNKRPMMSDLRESGCLSGDTLVRLAEDDLEVPISTIIGKSGFKVWALNESTMQLEKAIVSNAFSTGFKSILCLKTRLDRIIRATGNHKFLTPNGWLPLDKLTLGDRIAIAENLSNSDIKWDEIISINIDSKAEVYDLTVPHYHNFIANNIVVHNSIEQDADLIIMLYRDAYYNPDSPDRDITEIIIAKHRNGPTGIVKLLFDSQVTKFKNLAKLHNY